MDEQGIDVLLLSVGADLPWLTGYEAMPLERLTMLVLTADGDATLVVPRLEAPRVVERPGVFAIRAVGRDRRPRRARRRRGRAAPRPRPSATAPGPGSCSTCSSELPSTAFSAQPRSPAPLRAHKDARRDRGAASRRRRRRPGRRRSCRAATSRSSVAPRPRSRPTSGADCVAEGHQRVNFAIVAAGENAASPHHDAGHARDQVGRSGAVRLRGHPRRVLLRHHPLCVDRRRPRRRSPTRTQCSSRRRPRRSKAATVGTPCEDVDGAARASSPRRLRGELHPPHRSRHRRRGARGPVHRQGQLRAARTWPRVLDRARHLPRRTVRAASRGHRGCDLSGP